MYMTASRAGQTHVKHCLSVRGSTKVVVDRRPVTPQEPEELWGAKKLETEKGTVSELGTRILTLPYSRLGDNKLK